MQIGVIGSGALGTTLAQKLANLGHRVSIANSRGPDSLASLAASIRAVPVTVVQATAEADIVIVAIPSKAVPDLPSGLFDQLPDGGVVIDTGNYHPQLRDGHIEAIDRGLPDSEWVAQQLEHPVIKAFNNIFAESLRHKSTPAGATGRIALSAAGDPNAARTTVLHLIDELGFDPVNAGHLSESWRQQPGTPAYCQDLTAAALRHALGDADHGRIANYRAAEEARIRQSMAAHNAAASE